MNKSTKQKIIGLIKEKDRSVKELRGLLGLGPAIIHRHLKDLVSRGEIVKIGSAPKVIYRAAQAKQNISVNFNSTQKKLLNDFPVINEA